jgi:uncharacterized protein
MEIKNSGLVQDVNGRIITGYLSNFGNVDFDNDIIEKGAFSKTITENKSGIFFLNQHNWKQPLAKFKVLQEDEKGLYFESEPIANTTYGNDVIELYKSGLVGEHSIGFSTIKADYDKKAGLRTIKEVKLYEGSAVTLGANPQTPFLGIKSNKEVEVYIKALRNGNFTDELALQLEAILKSISLDKLEPVETTPIEIEPINIKQQEIIKTLNQFQWK